MTASLVLSVIGLIISLAATGISVFLVGRQIRFQRHANEVPITISLGQEYRSEEFQRAQNYVLDSLSAKHTIELGVSALPVPDRDYVLRVVSFYTWLGGLVFFDLIDKEIIIGLLGNRIDRTWRVLEPYILREREVRNIPDFLVFYEDFVCRVREHGLAVNRYRSKLRRLTFSSS